MLCDPTEGGSIMCVEWLIVSSNNRLRRNSLQFVEIIIQ